MKRRFYILPILFLASCQLIPKDVQLTLVEKSKLVSNRTTLICEFTGYKCLNCPNAANEAHTMLDFWGKNLVVVEMHPPSNSFTKYTKEEYNFTCPAADVYYKAFGGQPTTGLPTGVINLAGVFTDYTSWGGAYVQSAIAQSSVKLQAEAAYNESARELTATVTMDNLAQQAQNLQLIAWLTEDSVMGAQKMPDGTTNNEYYHNHLLRDTLTIAWGEPLLLQSTLSYELKPYILPEKFVDDHCHLVLLALRDDEVIQALQLSIK